MLLLACLREANVIANVAALLLPLLLHRENYTHVVIREKERREAKFEVIPQLLRGAEFYCLIRGERKVVLSLSLRAKCRERV